MHILHCSQFKCRGGYLGALSSLQCRPCQVDGCLHCPCMGVIVGLQLLQQRLQDLVHLQHSSRSISANLCNTSFTCNTAPGQSQPLCVCSRHAEHCVVYGGTHAVLRWSHIKHNTINVLLLCRHQQEHAQLPCTAGHL